MLRRSAPLLAGLALCGALLAGCADAPAVPSGARDAVRDRLGYLLGNFRPADLPAEVVAIVARADGSPARFRKLVVRLKTIDESPGAPEARAAVENRNTFIDAGNGLMQWMDELVLEGQPVLIEYQLSYRGIFTLRSRRVQVDPPFGGDFASVMSLHRFEPPLPPYRGTLDYRWQSGPARQHGEPAAGGLSCQWGRMRPASELHPKLSGTAQDLLCRGLDKDGAEVSRSERSYLADYGVAINRHIQSATRKTRFELIELEIE